MRLFSAILGKCKGVDQKSKNAEDRWRVDAEDEQQGDESQPLISLGLGIGGPTLRSPRGAYYDGSEKDNSFDRNNMKVVEEMKQEIVVLDDLHHDDHDQVAENEECRKCSVVMFTKEQVEELGTQMLIFKYLIWGLPVPFQLLLPIWRSFSSSSSSCAPPHFYRRSSPFLFSFHRSGVNRQQKMDPEPGRCRRTDGKKWRCHQSVVPNEKYCEKHMHRGSKRSRKLVEASPNSRIHNIVNLNRNNNPNRDIRPKLPKFPGNLDQNGPTMLVPGALALTNTTAKSKSNKQNEAKRGIIGNESIAVINRASGLDFSPRSVLQNDRGMKCPRVESCKNSTELSESRCKRTDGKKWQCKKEVIPDQKYCAQHINRGKTRSEKQSLGTSFSASEPQAPAYGSTSSSKFYGTEQAKAGLSLDTNLKISLPTRLSDPRSIVKDSTSQSSSTEATESDEGTDVSDTIALSP